MNIKSLIRNGLLFVLMVVASGLAIALRPTEMMATQRASFDLQTGVPTRFGDWSEERQTVLQVVDPGQQEFVNTIYKQTLSRTYVNSAGERVMLSLAYVEDQSDSFGVHLPEVCYPAQGFQLAGQTNASVRIGQATMPVKRVLATAGRRSEPITYWTTVGDAVAISSTGRKLAQLGYALRGQIPDGMLVRVSSISGKVEQAYALQARFIDDFRAALSGSTRQLVFGQSAPG